MTEANSETEIIEEIDATIKYICEGLRKGESKDLIFADANYTKTVGALASLIEARAHLNESPKEPLKRTLEKVGTTPSANINGISIELTNESIHDIQQAKAVSMSRKR